MTDKHRRLKLVRFIELLSAVGLIFAPGLVYGGVADPYISPPDPVFGNIDVLLLMIIGGGVIWIQPSKFLRRRYWRAAAAEAGLDLADGGMSGPRKYAGTIQGRPVRMKTGTTTMFRSSPQPRGEDAKSYTLIEAELSQEAAEGVVIGPSEQDAFVTPYDVASYADCKENGLVAVGSGDGLAEAVLTPAVQEALLSIESLNQVYLGNARAAGDRLPEDDRMDVGTPAGVTRLVDAAHDTDMNDGDWLGGKGCVSHLSRGVIFDEEELRRQAEAVATAANVFETTI